MTDHLNKSTFAHGDDCNSGLAIIFEYILMVFMKINMLFTIDRIFHILLRLFMPKRVHPTMRDVLPPSSRESDYPLVAVQLPMMNEIECCESAINCACNLDWPKSRLLIQVLDDSTDEQTRIVINKCVQRWHAQGVQIKVYRRSDRQGFKAGNLKFGMSFLTHVDYVAIFDVDFLPNKDFLHKTVPALIQDPKVAFVQARWTFINAKDTFLTRMQEIGLNFHHKCEQESRFRASLFFTFNGTGGIWRASAITSIGGWHTDALTEDLDLSLRAYLYGWRSIYMHDVECLSELPSTLSAYFSQLDRWMSGFVQVTKKMIPSIFGSSHIRWYNRLYCLWYLLRCWGNVSTVISLALLMPIKIWMARIGDDSFNVIFVPVVINFSFVAFTFDEAHLVVAQILFVNAMSINRAWSIVSQLFDNGQPKQWVVTSKVGSGISQACFSSKTVEKKKISKSERNARIAGAFSVKNTTSWRWHWSYSNFLLINHYCRSIYQQARRKCQMIQFHRKNLVMGMYLFAISYLAFRKSLYFTGTYMFATSVMCFILAFNWIGR